jgi:hypothetical protein
MCYEWLVRIPTYSMTICIILEEIHL